MGPAEPGPPGQPSGKLARALHRFFHRRSLRIDTAVAESVAAVGEITVEL